MLVVGGAGGGGRVGDSGVERHCGRKERKGGWEWGGREEGEKIPSHLSICF